MQVIIDFFALQFICPVCLRCGSFRVQNSFFCQNCERQFLKKQLLNRTRTLIVEGQAYPVQFLISWIPYKSDSLSEAVYLLKSYFSFPSWRYYTAQLQITNDARSAALVPVPGRQPGRTAYHTQYFSQSLSPYLKAPVLPCLIRRNSQGSYSGNSASNTQQKHLNREGRAQVQFQFLEEFTLPLLSCERVILIDDIITTGHTLSACIAALKPHISPTCCISIIALLSREKI